MSYGEEGGAPYLGPTGRGGGGLPVQGPEKEEEEVFPKPEERKKDADLFGRKKMPRPKEEKKTKTSRESS